LSERRIDQPTIPTMKMKAMGRPRCCVLSERVVRRRVQTRATA
jgi:hypothetical protein